MAKYIIVCGGVYSGTGKGVACASMGLLMRMRGHTVQYIKFDPYLNTSASILAPKEHGEMWVTEDGHETDLDLGHVERLCGITTSKDNICTSGTLYKELINEQDKFLGSSLQVIPHLTDKIISRIEYMGTQSDIVFVEIGGTVGDVESQPFFEAIRQFKRKHMDDCLIFMIAPILWVPTINEFKTKPLQNAVRTLQHSGIHPDILICRCPNLPNKSVIHKICKFTDVNLDCIILAPDVPTIYQVPIEFYNAHLDSLIIDKLSLNRTNCKIHKYKDLVEKYLNNSNMENVVIAIINKYDNYGEAYISLREALCHASISEDVNVNIKWINAEDLEKPSWKKFFVGVSGIIVPGGFDHRGVEGKIRAIKFARENKIPFLGICLGLQCAVIEFARNVCHIENANSLEFCDTDEPVIHYVKGQESITQKSGTMRLGSYLCELSKNSLAHKLYKNKIISERHRHRYEVNKKYIDEFSNKGLTVSGSNPDTGLVEIMELNRSLHPFFIGTQAHPEFKSRLGNPSPLFRGLVSAAKQHI